MAKSLSPPNPTNAVQTMERPLSVKYTEESDPMVLSEAEDYFCLSIPKAFRVNEGAYSLKGNEGVAKGE